MAILEKVREKVLSTINERTKENVKTTDVSIEANEQASEKEEVKELASATEESGINELIPETKEAEDKEENPSIQEISKPQEMRKIVKVCKMGSDHNFANINNHDFAFNLLNMKVVTDGCGSGKHSEVGTRIFGQLFARKVKEYYEREESINESNFITVVDEIFEKMLSLCSDTSFIFQNYCFTILVCFEFENEFVVYSCGDGYIIKEDSSGITFEQLDDGEYPCYYVYNFIEDKSSLSEYKDGVSFKVSRFSKKEYQNVGVATDGLRFYENLLDVEKNKFMKFLHEGKGSRIEVLINRNNRKNEMFHDDISICF